MNHADHNQEHGDDRILDHSAMQLSALLDGAIPPDEARFLLRRLQHDEELAACLGRWQLLGDVLRGQAMAPVDKDFARRVAAAIAADPKVAPGVNPRTRWLRWGGGAAFAASVAVLALFVNRNGPVQPGASAPAQVAVTTTTPAAPVSMTVVSPTRMPAPATPSAPEQAAQLASAVAVADLPRRALRRNRAQAQRATGRRSGRASEPVLAVVSTAAPATVAATPANPFAPRNTVLPSRPWPRALLPNAGTGAFTVDYGGVGATSYGPFAPRESIPATLQPTSGDDPQH